MTTDNIEPITLPPDIEIRHRASYAGITEDAVREAIIREKTSGHRTEDNGKLDAKRAKLESQLAEINAEEARQLGIATRYNGMRGALSRLEDQLCRARQKLALHESSVVGSRQNAREHLSDGHHHWGLCGDLIIGHVNQLTVVRVMGELIEELAVEVRAQQEKVAAFAAEHGITSPPKPDPED